MSVSVKKKHCQNVSGDCIFGGIFAIVSLAIKFEIQTNASTSLERNNSELLIGRKTK